MTIVAIGFVGSLQLSHRLISDVAEDNYIPPKVKKDVRPVGGGEIAVLARGLLTCMLQRCP